MTNIKNIKVPAKIKKQAQKVWDGESDKLEITPEMAKVFRDVNEQVDYILLGDDVESSSYGSVADAYVESVFVYNQDLLLVYEASNDYCVEVTVNDN
ncbi:hypothetical protein [Mammaliicoccus phage vB_MscM-PMS3]|nr:hypothetical protein [Mammaliicoccus phage vB_MscM-PMS3]WBF82118.1 hypothetical protein [Mammaliicoccus virus vB_MscM-PMS2]